MVTGSKGEAESHLGVRRLCLAKSVSNVADIGAQLQDPFSGRLISIGT